jgi:hypothetical protein
MGLWVLLIMLAFNTSCTLMVVKDKEGDDFPLAILMSLLAPIHMIPYGLARITKNNSSKKILAEEKYYEVWFRKFSRFEIIWTLITWTPLGITLYNSHGDLGGLPFVLILAYLWLFPFVAYIAFITRFEL